MELNNNTSTHLVIEESLQILEDCTQCGALSSINSNIIRQHIQRLKSFYSPWFDFTHAESGSYFYAALHCMLNQYIEKGDAYHINFSTEFTESMHCLANISLHALNPNAHKYQLIEHLIKLGHIWRYTEYDDMQSLLIFALQSMRNNLIQSNSHLF